MKSLFFYIRTLGLIIILCGFYSITRAQSADTVKSHGWHSHDMAGSMGIELEYRKVNVAPLNQYLNQQGFSSLANHDIWYNLTSTKVYCNKVITMLSVGVNTPSSAYNNNTKATLYNGQIMIDAGYNLTSKSAFRLYPFAGINLGGSMLKIKDQNNINNTNDFGAALNSQSTSKTFTQSTFAVEAGAGFDYLIKLKPKQFDCFTIERNIPVGIRAGYYIPTHVADWRIENHNIGNGPVTKTNSFFATLSIGLGFEKKR